MNKSLLHVTLTIAVIGLLYSCGDDSTPELVQNKFLGTWIEKYPERFDGFPDTIVFQSNGLIGKHHFFKGDHYRFENDSLIIKRRNPNRILKYLLNIVSESEIEICNFLDRDFTNTTELIPYIKLEEQQR